MPLLMRLHRFIIARMPWLRGAAGVAIFLIAAVACAADRSIVADGNGAKSLQESFRVAAMPRIEIDNVRGSVQVIGWNQSEVELGGNLGSGSKLEISANAQDLSMRVVAANTGWFGGNGPKSPSNLILHVPLHAVLDVHVVSADAQVRGVGGASLKVVGVSGKLDVQTAAAIIEVSSVSGDVAVSATAMSDSVRVQSVSGDIRVEGVGGRIKLETVSGNLGLTATRVQELNTGSVSGDANISMALLPQARVHLESMSGDIHANLPTTLSARIDANTFSGDIDSDYGRVANKRHGPGSSLNAVVESGDAQINVQTFSGDIQLRKVAASLSK